jgi:hypothetical protein
MYARAELAPAIAAGLVVFDAEQAKKCLATPQEDFCEGNNFWILGDCHGVFRGAVPNGGKCFSIYFIETVNECQSGACVGHSLGSCTPGTCTPYLAEAAICRGDGGAAIEPNCAPGFHCDHHDRCVKDGDPGAPCVDTGDLCRNAYPLTACGPLADGGTGAECTRPRAGGAPCEANGVNLSIVCRSGTCTEGTCVDTIDAGTLCGLSINRCPVGQVCISSLTDPAVCGAPLAAGAPCIVGSPVCIPDYACTAHDGGATCDPLPKTGESCDGPCAAGLYCSSFGDSGLACTPIRHAGETCRGEGDDACAEGLRCEAATKTCKAFTPFGATCASDRECERGLYCDDTSKRCVRWKLTGTPCTRDEQCDYGHECGDAGTCASVCVVPPP